MAVTLGKDVTVSGVANARSVTADATANEIDVTALGDTARKFRKSHIELTVEVECVDDPGVSVGGTFTLGGATVGGSQLFVVTAVTENQPLDDIVTYTVSGTSTASA